jgi:hypothetical protein
MTSRIATSLATLLSATLASFYAAAGVCAFLRRDPLTLRDTELFYKSPSRTPGCRSMRRRATAPWPARPSPSPM